jgi:hypothetical protein
MALRYVAFEIQDKCEGWNIAATGDDLEELRDVMREFNMLALRFDVDPPGKREETDMAGVPAPDRGQEKKISEAALPFLSATSETDLYELCHSRRVSRKLGGTYCIYRSDRNGNRKLFDDPDFKKYGGLEAATAEFRRWAAAKGYGIIGDAGDSVPGETKKDAA